MKIAKGVGIFQVTVKRLDGPADRKGTHQLDVAAGSWLSALAAAAEAPGEFEYHTVTGDHICKYADCAEGEESECTSP